MLIYKVRVLLPEYSHTLHHVQFNRCMAYL
jgi:hypothetical protein